MTILGRFFWWHGARYIYLNVFKAGGHEIIPSYYFDKSDKKSSIKGFGICLIKKRSLELEELNKI